MSESTEKLQFKIGLSGTYHDKKPAYTVSIDDTEYAAGTVAVDSDAIFYVEFAASLAEDQQHTLKIRLDNKTSTDTKTNNGDIVADMLLNIASIEVDEIDLGSLLWSHSVYKIDHPQKFNNGVVTELTNCVNLGWNGSYQLTFKTPFYIWLLENI
jgi:hypothetical protein